MNRPYVFNNQTLKAIIASEDYQDEDSKEFLGNMINDFQTYANDVLHFEDRIKKIKQSNDLEGFQAQVTQLDASRKNHHDLCLNNVNVFNRIAKMQNLPPFCDLKGKDAKEVNRTDIGDEIMIWSSENFKTISKEQLEKFDLVATNVKKDTFLENYAKERVLTKEDQLVETFNHLTRDNPCLIAKEDEHYHFHNATTYAPLTPEVAIDRLEKTLKKHHKDTTANHKIIESVLDLVDPEHKHHQKQTTPQNNHEKAGLER